VLLPSGAREQEEKKLPCKLFKVVKSGV